MVKYTERYQIMNRLFGKKTLSIFLVLTMVFSTFVGVLPYATLEVKVAETEKKVTGLGVGAIANPQVAESTPN